MGVRLYPNIPDVELANDAQLNLLEKFAGVPEGTGSRLVEFYKEHRPNLEEYDSHPAYSEAYHAFLDLLHQEEELCKLHDFNLFGWGKFQCMDEIPDSGSSKDKKFITELFIGNSLDEEVLDLALEVGVNWG